MVFNLGPTKSSQKIYLAFLAKTSECYELGSCLRKIPVLPGSLSGNVGVSKERVAANPKLPLN